MTLFVLYLEKVDGNLGQVGIILKERESYLKDLRKDRDHAVKFKALNDSLRTNKASLVKRQLDTKSGEELDLELVLREENQDLDTGNFGRYSVTLVELLPHPWLRTNGAREYTAVLLVSSGLITRLWPF